MTYADSQTALVVALAADVPALLWGDPGQGKCQPGSTLIVDPTTGERRTLLSLIEAGERGEDVTVASLGFDYRLAPAKATEFHRNGIRPVYRLTTRTGRVTLATDNHPFLTVLGWKPLAALSTGSRIAVPRALHVDGTESIPDHDVLLLGLLTGDGSLNQEQDTCRVPAFICAENSPLIPLVVEAAAHYGVIPKCSPNAPLTWRLSHAPGRGRNPLTQMLRGHDMMHRAERKRVPQAIFTATDRQVAIYLNALLATDGWISPGENNYPHVGYGSISKGLCSDVQHLLSRFGVLSRVVRKDRAVYEGTDKAAWEVIVTDHASLRIVMDRIGAMGKEAACVRLSARLDRTVPNTNIDTIPREVWQTVEAEKGDLGWHAIARGLGFTRPKPSGALHRTDRDVGRSRLGKIAEVIGSENLANLAASDILWDEVVSVEYVRDEETFDLTVPGTHNYVADDVIVHNSSVNKAIAEAQGWHHEPLILSVREPSDLVGIPVVVGTETILAPPSWAKRLVAAGGGLLDLDELSTAPSGTQAAALRVVLDRVAGDLPLPNVRIVASANPPDQNGGWDLEAPMANRFCHLDWKLDADTFRTGMSFGWTVPPVPVPDPAELERATAEAKILVAAFIGARPDLLTVLPKSDDARGRAWPSPRSWEMAARLYGAAQACGVNETVTNLLIIGTIGQGAAHEFLTFVDEADLPDPESFLADPDSIKGKIPERGDRTYAVGASVLSATLTNNTPERWKACGLVLAEIARSKSDVAVSLGVRWYAERPPNAAWVKEMTTVLTPILKLINPERMARAGA